MFNRYFSNYVPKRYLPEGYFFRTVVVVVVPPSSGGGGGGGPYIFEDMPLAFRPGAEDADLITLLHCFLHVIEPARLSR